MSRTATKLVFIQRSDGKLHTFDSKNRKQEENCPTSEQLAKTKGENGQWSFYQELELTDKRNYDWRKKLGGLLIETMMATLAKDKQEALSKLTAEKYVLAAFPENYRLYEHRRVTNPDNPEERGVGDRSDTYLYGYPQGRKKRFRSPNDFFHHLLWLVTDETGDPDNCQCKFCASDEAQKAFLEIEKMQQQKSGTKPDEIKASIKPTGMLQNSAPPTTTAKIAVEVPKRPTQPTSTKTPSQPPQSPAPTAQLAVPPINNPTPPVQLLNSEQILDAQPNKFMFRPGEVIWYQRNNDRGGAVGLAVVTARELRKEVNRPNRAAYHVQPLSHPFHHPSTVYVEDEQLLKPWLAFSPPENFHESLRKINVTFDQIPWRQLLDGMYGEGDTEADASIFAAKTIDASYSPFDVLGRSPHEIKYNGVFLGGEKIWRGEALRLKHGNGKDIMILSEIIEKVPPTTASNATQQALELLFIGDIYSYRSVPQQSKQPPRNHYLPNRVQQDLEFRNGASMARGKGSSYWKFIQPLVRLSAAEIKGRWYESRNMIPILHSPEVLAQRVKDGEVEDIGDSLNSHGDSSAIVADPANRRKDNRLEAFGQAIPEGTRFSTGVRMQGQPQQHTQQHGLYQAQKNVVQAQPSYGRAVEARHQQNERADQEDTEMADFVDMEQTEGRFEQNYMG